MALSEHEKQLVQELSILNYGKVFQRLTKSQKIKITDEFNKVNNLPYDKHEAYLSYKMMKKYRRNN